MVRKNGMKRLRYATIYGRAVTLYLRRRNGKFSRKRTFFIPTRVVRTENGTVVIGRNVEGTPISFAAENINWQSVKMV